MKSLLVTILTIIFLIPLYAEDIHSIDKSFEGCFDKSKSITAKMVRCCDEARDKWDVELNKYYDSLMAILDEDDKEKLEKSQSAWIKFKELEFEFIPYHYADPGSYQGPSTAAHEMDIIRERALQLQNYYEQAKEGRELMEDIEKE